MGVKFYYKTTKNIARKNAFSLVELLVVMAIVAVALGLGLSSLLTLRQTTQMRNTMNEFIDAIQSSRNQARNITVNLQSASSAQDKDNLVVDSVDNLAFKGLRVVDNNFMFGDCQESSTGTYDCVFTQGIKASDNSNIDVAPIDYNNSSASACQALIFAPGNAQGAFASLSSANEDILVVNTSVDKCYYQFNPDTRPGNSLILEYEIFSGQTSIVN